MRKLIDCVLPHRPFLGCVFGVGGGFVCMPAMIYLIGIPTLVAVGTDLLEVLE